MGYRMDLRDVDRMFARFREEYEIWASGRLMSKGRYPDINLIKYARVDRAEEIEYREKSDLPAKKVSSPVTQSLLYFIENEFIESRAVSRKLLAFIRSCDIHVQHRQEKIYLTDDGYEDIYCKRMSKKVKTVMMEYDEDWDTCLCVGTGTSRIDDYLMAIRFGENVLEFQVKDDAFILYFEGMEECPSEPRFMEKNELILMIPEILDREVLTKPKERLVRRQFDGRCISCGARTMACSTHTCFTTTDIIYNENYNVGERKGTSASCQVKNFIDMAGGMSFRSRAGDRMRYKVPHKPHDYKARSKDYYMCVGRGRCMDRCPGYISIVATMNKMAGAVVEIRAGRQVQEGG